MTTQTSHSAPLRLGMIGGGLGSFIGPVHRMAASLDGEFVLTAGALSSSAERAAASARALGLAQDRSYADWREMLQREAARPAGERIDAVAVVTPNHAHVEPALAFVQAGFHAVIEKPMTRTVAEAAQLVAAAERAGVVVGVTYNYTGYPMVMQAGAMVRAGLLGRIRTAFVEYHQGWLASPLETTGQKQAAWRTDPALAGPGGALGDIGSHAECLLSTVTGLRIEALSANLRSFVPTRTLDDDATVMLRLEGGAHAVLTASQVCIGEENNLSLRVHGDAGSLWWRQEAPDALVVCAADGVKRTLTRGSSGLDAAAQSGARLPPGHPEGFIEAFANIYRAVAGAIRASRGEAGRAPATSAFPTAADGLRGVRFIERSAASARAGGAWVDFPR